MGCPWPGEWRVHVCDWSHLINRTYALLFGTHKSLTTVNRQHTSLARPHFSVCVSLSVHLHLLLPFFFADSLSLTCHCQRDGGGDAPAGSWAQTVAPVASTTEASGLGIRTARHELTPRARPTQAQNFFSKFDRLLHYSCMCHSESYPDYRIDVRSFHPHTYARTTCESAWASHRHN